MYESDEESRITLGGKLSFGAAVAILVFGIVYSAVETSKNPPPKPDTAFTCPCQCR